MLMERFFNIKDTPFEKFFNFFSGKTRKIEIEGFVIDFENKSITIPPTWKINFEGDAHLTSKNHFMIDSGISSELEPRADIGYAWALWLNCEKNEKGQPLRFDIEHPVEFQKKMEGDQYDCGCSGKENKW